MLTLNVKVMKIHLKDQKKTNQRLLRKMLNRPSDAVRDKQTRVIY